MASFKLNEFQQAVVDALASGPQVAEACPGSGKTATTEQLVPALLASGVDPLRLLVVTFSNKASSESRRRTAKTLWPDATAEELAYFESPKSQAAAEALRKAAGWSNQEFDNWKDDPVRRMVAEKFSTIHALCLRTLADLGFKFKVLAPGGNGRDSSLYWDAETLVKDGIKELDWDASKKAVQWWFGAAINALVEPHEAEEWFAARLQERGGPVWDAPKLAELYRRYRDFCKQHQAADFDMMQAALVKLLRTKPHVLAKLERLYDVIVVDEAQDTNPLQCEVLWAMARKTRRIVFVGDVDQSMYAFRGAQPEVLRSLFEAAWPDVRRFNLPINYRSTQAVIDAAEALIRDNYGGDLDRYLKPFEARPGAPQGEPLDYTETSTFDELAAEVAALVKERPGDWFVLSRTRAECASIHTHLVREKVPAINKSGGLLFGAPHVRKVLAYARLACDYHGARDDLEVLGEIANVASTDFRAPMNRRRHLPGCHKPPPWKPCGCPLVYEEGVDASPVRFYGKKAIHQAGSWAGILRQQDQTNRGGYPTLNAKGARDLVAFVNRLATLADDARATLHAIIHGSVLNWLKHDQGIDDEDLAENGKAEDFDLLIGMTEPDQTMEDYLRKVDELTAGSAEGDESESVLVGTIHWSKGAERPGVVLNTTRLPIVPPEPRPGQLPTTEPPTVEEERRLAYVAITRAQERVHLVGSREWNDNSVETSEFVLALADKGHLELEGEGGEPFPGWDGTEGQGHDDYTVDPALDLDAPLSDEERRWLEGKAAFAAREREQEEQAFLNTDPNDRPANSTERVIARQLQESAKSEGRELSEDEKTWLEWKGEFARREAEQEARAFMSDPDFLGFRATGDVGGDDLLRQFPAVGRFEDNIYRPSARELAEAMPDWMPTIENNQLVLVKDLAEGHRAKCWTSITVGNIAGGTGEDSIRVVREDTAKDGRVFRFKNTQDWVTRSVPQDADTPEKAAAHLAAKVEAQVDAFTRKCPECGAVQVKCRAGKGKDARLWWKNTSCNHKTEGGW